MAKDNVFEWDTTAANNTDVGGVSVAENMLPGLLNNAIREAMAQLRREVAGQGSAIASAGTTAIAATGTSGYAHITGTTTITSFGTANAGICRIVEFDGILTLTHNATSLILPGSGNITTAAGDVAFLVSLGSGNWKCLTYQTQSGSVVGGFSSLTATSTDAGATAGPDIKAFRNSASPADNDLIGRLLFNGRDESSNEDTYASVEAQILDATGATEDALLLLKTVVAGTLAARLTVGQGLQVGAAPTGGDQGVGTINADAGYYKDGVLISSGVIQKVVATSSSTDSTSTAIPSDNTIPQVGEGDEVFSQAFTPRSAASTLTVTAVLHLSHASSNIDLTAALFVDGAANAVAAAGDTSHGAALAQITLRYTVASGSTAARTYSVRYGGASGTTYFNRLSGGSIYGGVITSTLVIEESL
jgi:hypothetical protein